MKLHKLAAALAFGLCVVSALGFAKSAEGPTIRPFKAQVPQTALEDLRRRIAATRWPDKETDPVAGGPAGSAAGARPVLGPQLRLAQSGSEAERASAIHDQHRRGGHPLHPRPFPSSECASAHRHAWMARLGHRAAQDHRPAHGSNRARRPRRGRFRRRHPVLTGLRLFRKTDRHRLGARPYRASLGGADEAPRVHALCRPGRRLGLPHFQLDGAAGAQGIGRHSRQPARGSTARSGRGHPRRWARAGRDCPRRSARCSTRSLLTPRWGTRPTSR